MQQTIALFIFRRDLRVVDNMALNAAVRWCRIHGAALHPMFIFVPVQIDPKKNQYFSNAAVQFMCESIGALAETIKHLGGCLHLYCCDNTGALKQASRNGKVVAVFYNKDVSVYANIRDKTIQEWCSSHNIQCFGDFEDYDLINSNEGLLSDGRPYTTLSHYFSKFTNGIVQVRKPDSVKFRARDFATGEKGDVVDMSTLFTPMPSVEQRGGRANGVKILSRIHAKELANYGNTRDLPALERGTSKASAHLHFGTISVREMYWALVSSSSGNNTVDHPLIRELVFRSFYLKIFSYHPELQRGTAFKHELDANIPYMSTKGGEGGLAWAAWTEGKTGFPLVDAGMRQLLTTGWVHNRVRMLVAVVPTRYFLLDWRECSKYFYTKLVDADTFSNTAGWQWCAGIGCDSVPYFRAPMNPYIQSKKFDPDAVYIKRWIPELADVAPKDIHKWDDANIRSKYPRCKYIAPLIYQKTASRRAVATMKAAAA